MRFGVLLLAVSCSSAEPAQTPDRDAGSDAPTPPAGLPHLIDWANVSGVEGGIPARDTVCKNLDAIDATGATDVLPAIQAAIDSCPPDQVVKLPAGTFRLDGSLSMRSRVTLRGAGPTSVLKPAQTIFFNGGLGRKNANIVSGSDSGSTRVVTAAPPADLTVGSSMLIDELNDPSFVHPYGYEENATAPLLCSYCDEPYGGTRVRGQMVRVTAIAGSTIDFTPALYSSYASSRDPRIDYLAAPSADQPNVLTYAGIEDLTIDPTGPSTVIRFEGAQNSWLAGVSLEIRANDAPAIIGYFAHRIEIRHGSFTGHTPVAQAILSQVHTEGWRVEDNAFVAVNLSFLQVGRQGGHVFAYNYLHSNSGDTTALINDNGNHGAHPQFILFEGNKLAKHHADSIHGSSSHYTLFRNHLRGRRDETTFGAGCVWIDSWNYHYNVVGNVLGYPGMPEFRFEAESPEPIDDTMILWRFGYSGYNPYGAYPLSKSTTLRHGNFDFGRNQTDWDPTIESHVLPASLYLAKKPAFFGKLPFPPIGPDVDGYFANELPAEYRMKHGGADPP
ncbi:MAG: glycosyl hydrolase family 28-related protein [Polyangiaceae bacterium]